MSEELHTPDYSKFSEDEIEAELSKSKTDLHRKVRQQLQTRDAKKEAAAAYREQLTEMTEEIERLVGVIDVLLAEKKRRGAMLRSV